MSADRLPASTVDDKTQEEARSLVIKGVINFLDATRAGPLRWFKGFEDLEVAVNKKSLTFDNCEAVLECEVAHIVRMTEVFHDKTDASRVPRTLMFGIVMRKMDTSAFIVRLWGALTPTWQGGSPETLAVNTKEDIAKITEELMYSMCKVCQETSSAVTASNTSIEVLD
jgi:hypothetical protein